MDIVEVEGVRLNPDISRQIRQGRAWVEQNMEKVVKKLAGPPECERVECGAPIVMMVQKNTGFCSRLCEEYEAWEEEFDEADET